LTLPILKKNPLAKRLFNIVKIQNEVLVKIKNILITTLIAFLFIILLQNTQVVSIQFFFWNISMSRIILILFIFLLGFVSGYFSPRKR